MRCLERLFRRAGLPLGMSQGFHPKPRVTFPSALAVGIEGREEVMELELSEPCSAHDVEGRLAARVPPGLVITVAEVLPEGCRKARVASVSYEVPIPFRRRPGLEERISRLLAAPTCVVVRGARKAPLDLRPQLRSLSLDGATLRMRLRCSQEGCAGPRDVLAALDLGDLEQEGVHLTRIAVELLP